MQTLATILSPERIQSMCALISQTLQHGLACVDANLEASLDAMTKVDDSTFKVILTLRVPPDGPCASFINESRFIGMPKNELGPTPQERGPLGTCLWTARKGHGWSLREAEEQSDVSNAYISQIESGSMPKPSPGILLKLANTYKIPYQQLMEMAGHLAPTKTVAKRRGVLPTSTLADIELTDDEEKEVRQYIAFIKMRGRKST